MNYILGLDPGRQTGYAVMNLADGLLIESGVFKAPVKWNYDEVLISHGQSAELLLMKYKNIDHVAIESGYSSRNADSAAKMSELRGALKMAVDPCVTYSPKPSQVKKACGKGNLEKDEVMEFLIENVQGFEGSSNNNESDAVAVAYWLYKKLTDVLVLGVKQ